MTFIIHKPDGSENKRLLLTNKGVVGLGLLICSIFIFSEVPAALADRMRSEEAADLRPEMEKLANEGKESAAIWLVKNYYPEKKLLLAKLVDNGNAEALYMQGRVLVSQGDSEGGMRLIERSAKDGFFPAIQSLKRK